jgi:hypothetical protein
MNFRKIRFFAAALGAVFLSTMPKAAEAPETLSYATSCVLVDPDTADGFVTNHGQGSAYLVNGMVEFVFTADNSISHPAIAFSAASIVPAGQTVRVAHINLTFEPLPGETCRFEVKDSISRAR